MPQCAHRRESISGHVSQLYEFAQSIVWQLGSSGE